MREGRFEESSFSAARESAEPREPRRAQKKYIALTETVASSVSAPTIEERKRRKLKALQIALEFYLLPATERETAANLRAITNSDSPPIGKLVERTLRKGLLLKMRKEAKLLVSRRNQGNHRR